MTKPALVSIFLVNYNTCGLLGQCLKSIFETKGDKAVEVFVADNNSTDGSADMVESEFPGVSLTTFSKNVGYTRALNSMLPAASGKYYLMMHPDVELLPNTLERFTGFLDAHPQVGIVGGNLFYPDGTPNPCEIICPGLKNDLLCLGFRLVRKLPGGGVLLGDYNPAEWTHNSTTRVNWVWDACMMARRDVFQRIGYFDEQFYVWYADWDLCKRAGEVGWSTYYLHSAIAIHHERQSFGKKGVIGDEVKYKVDGWHSAASQIGDRYRFVKKHCGQKSFYGVKALNLVENVLRLWLIIGAIILKPGGFGQIPFQLRACIQTLGVILKS